MFNYKLKPVKRKKQNNSDIDINAYYKPQMANRVQL